MVFPLKETHHRIASIMISLHHAAHQQIKRALCENSAITNNLILVQSAFFAMRAIINLLLWANYGQVDLSL
jgi:hypothetical protein